MKNALSIFLILASIGIFFGFVKPEWKKVSAVRQELTVYKETLEQAELLEKQVATLQAQVDALDPKDMAKLPVLIPSTINDVKLILAMEDVASKYGLQMLNINLSNEDAAAVSSREGYNSVDISFNVTAAYPTFMYFISALENNLRLMDVVGVSFTPGEKEGYDFAVTVRTYWLK